MTDDPCPELRCRCVFREKFIDAPELAHLLNASDYQDRCKQKPTQEDGLCDHCRGEEGCVCCVPLVRGSHSGGCRWHESNRRLVALTEPCAALPSVQEISA
jgi:hypothetical protein